ncbi:MAG: hypothetical protein WC389_12925 [Lutibacter sp.]|jgi:hypothetical protein
MEKQCPVCKTMFHVKPSHYQRRKACSKLCQSELYKITFKGENNPHWSNKTIDVKCLICGVIFKSQISYKRKYCSYKCSGIAKIKNKKVENKRKYKIHTCKKCGIKIHKGRVYCKNCSPKNKTKRMIISYCKECGIKFEHYEKTKRIYCSIKCRLSRLKGSNNPNWKGGKRTLSEIIRHCDKNKKLIKKILKRDNYTCQLCGQIGGNLEVDHIYNFSDILQDFLNKYVVLDINEFKYELFLIALKYKPFWDANNLRTLCDKCNWDKQLQRNKTNRLLISKQS